jgi:hypothetical protein
MAAQNASLAGLARPHRAIDGPRARDWFDPGAYP